MVLVDVDPVGPEGPQGGDELGPDLLGPEAFGPVHEAVEAVAELGGDDPAVAVVPGQVVPDEALDPVIAVALGRVDEVDAALRGLVEDGVHLGLFEGPPPLPAELPGAEADRGDLEPRPAENAVFHDAIRPFIY